MTARNRKVPRIVEWALVAAMCLAAAANLAAEEIQFVFTSDLHYGVTRPAFQGAKDVDAHVVNAALVAKINALPAAKLPADYGLRAGKDVGTIDFVVVGGDIANREEGTADKAIQSAAVSWRQFKDDYVDGLALKDKSGSRAQLFVIPGNHDVSNAVGYYKPMYPARDASSMAEIYNLMLKPATPKTRDTYNYATDRIHYSRDMGGIHFVFVNMWPDSAELAWLEGDLKSVSASTPVIFFAHDQPDLETKHLTNPNGAGDINATDKFENLLVKSAETKVSDPSDKEQMLFEDFVRKHPNLSVYFHGNSNANQYYDYVGPDKALDLHVVRVDSPMKGDISSTDETRLSFQLVTLDTTSRLMTVRECLWDTDPRNPAAAVAFGGAETIALLPRPAVAAK